MEERKNETIKQLSNEKTSQKYCQKIIFPVYIFCCVPYLPRFPEKKAVSSCGKSRLAGKKFQLWHKSVAGSA